MTLNFRIPLASPSQAQGAQVGTTSLSPHPFHGCISVAMLPSLRFCGIYLFLLEIESMSSNTLGKQFSTDYTLPTPIILFHGQTVPKFCQCKLFLSWLFWLDMTISVFWILPVGLYFLLQSCLYDVYFLKFLHLLTDFCSTFGSILLFPCETSYYLKADTV